MRRLFVVFAMIVVATDAAALTDEEVFRNFRFNFLNPGARSLALGGAFVSLADDATAAQANPAGLGYFRNLEGFAEYRFTDQSARALTLSETLATGVRTSVATGTSPDDVGNISFLSFVTPIRRDRRLSIGVARWQVLDNRNDTTNRFSFRLTDPPGVLLVEGSGSIRTDVVNTLVSVGWRFPSDRLAIGASVVASRLDVRSEIQNFIVDTAGGFAGHEVLEPTLDLRTHIDEATTAYGFNLGLIAAPFQGFRVGAVYRRSPKFTVTETIDPEGPDANDDGFPDYGLDTRGRRSIFGCDPAAPCSFDNRFSLPDAIAVSLAWEARGDLTIVQDFEYVRYSQLLDGYVSGVNILTGPGATFSVDDAFEYHFGTEWVRFFKDRVPVAFRGGLFTERDSTIEAVSTGDNAFATPAAFPGRKAQVHLTAGLGFLWSGGRFKLDTAADFSRDNNQYVVSFIFRGM